MSGLSAAVFSGPVLPARSWYGVKPHFLAYFPSDIMSPSAPHLAGLPTETLECVLLHLPAQDVIKMEAVRRLLLTPHKRPLIFVLYDPG